MDALKFLIHLNFHAQFTRNFEEAIIDAVLWPLH
jgi:hypothetical protein